jgi:hypothetical protein
MTIEEYEEELRLHLESLDPSNKSILLTPKKDSGDMQTRLFLTPRPVKGSAQVSEASEEETVD